jgi:Flp pilus assembly protein TadG
VIRRFPADQGGTTAIEFAILSPIVLAILLGTLALGLGFWMKNALQQSATETARCIAIGAPACTATAAACDSAVPGICYLERVASQRGLSGLQARHVAIDRSRTYGAVSFTTVTVTYPVDLLGYRYALVVNGHFPNGV